MSTITTIEFPQPHVIRLAEPVDPATLGEGIPILVLAFKAPAAFVAAVAPARGVAGELAVDTKATPPEGTPMIAEITWPGLPNRVFVRVVAGRRTLRGKLRLAIEPDEAGKRDFLLSAARGDAVAIHPRRHRRYCVRLPVAWRPFGQNTLRDGIAEDLSTGGMLIAAGEDVEVGLHERVIVRVAAPTGEMVVSGRVRHIQRRRMQGGLVLGIKFEHRQTGEQRTLRRLLRLCAARGILLVDG